MIKDRLLARKTKGIALLLVFFSLSLSIRTYGQSDIRNITAMEVTEEMEVGWNLGNSFDVISRDKTAWGNPLPSKPIIDAVRAQGFKTLRIPITWAFHMGEAPDYTVEEEYLDRVEEVVNYGLNNDMYVIINTHHDEWIEPTFAQEEEVSDRLAKLWTQIANRFKDYNDFLIFETLNEPRLRNTPVEWIGNDEGRTLVNTYNQVSVDAIRATGGNNAERFLMIPTYAANTIPGSFDELVIPNNDPKIIVSIHTYFPFQFTLEQPGTASWGTAQELADLDAELDKVRSFFVAQGQAVVLGEWGTINKNNVSTRIDYTIEYVSRAKEKGLTTVVWDDGGNLQLYDRHGLRWTNDGQRIVDAIIQVVREGEGNLVTSTETGLEKEDNTNLNVYKSDGKLMLQYNLKENHTLNFRIIDTLGKTVKIIKNNELTTAGNHEFSWNGTSDSGASLPRGVYTAILQSESWRRTKKFVLD